MAEVLVATVVVVTVDVQTPVKTVNGFMRQQDFVSYEQRTGVYFVEVRFIERRALIVVACNQDFIAIQFAHIFGVTDIAQVD